MPNWRAVLERFRELGVQFATPLLAPLPNYRNPARGPTDPFPRADEMSTAPAAPRRG